MNELREAAPLEIALRRAIEALEGHTGTHNISCVCWDCETVLALRAALVASRAPVVDLSHPGDAYAGDTGILTNVSALAAPRALPEPTPQAVEAAARTMVRVGNSEVPEEQRNETFWRIYRVAAQEVLRAGYAVDFGGGVSREGGGST